MRNEQTAGLTQPRWSLMPLAGASQTVWRHLLHEARVTYRVIWRDLSVTVVPAALMCLTALHATERLSVGAAATALAKCCVYFLLHVYTFTIDNQLVGHEEDRINKPDRALPLGLISLRGARRRRDVSMLLFASAAWALGGSAFLGYAVAWIALTLAYNHWGMHRHWVTKNLVFITLYAVLLLAPAWQFAAPVSELGWRWILVVSVAMGITLNLQDLRDVEGDLLQARRTLPLVFGQDAARWMIAASIALLPLLIHYGLIYPRVPGLRAVAAEVLLGGLNWVVAVRTLRRRDPRSDHKTYMLHTYWFCAVLASGLLLT